MTNDQILDRLTAVKGIGIWTVQMFLMFSLRRPDVLPCGDLGIRNAVQKAYGLREPAYPGSRSRRSANIGAPIARSQVGISGEVSKLYERKP